MGFELRRGRYYYYDAVWEDGRCVKRYCGSGFASKAAAQQASARADRRALNNIAFMKFAQRIEDGEAMFTDAVQQAQVLMEAGLLADGCYQASHTWRRRRNNEHNNNRQT